MRSSTARHWPPPPRGVGHPHRQAGPPRRGPQGPSGLEFGPAPTTTMKPMEADALDYCDLHLCLEAHPVDPQPDLPIARPPNVDPEVDDDCPSPSREEPKAQECDPEQPTATRSPERRARGASPTGPPDEVGMPATIPTSPALASTTSPTGAVTPDDADDEGTTAAPTVVPTAGGRLPKTGVEIADLLVGWGQPSAASASGREAPRPPSLTARTRPEHRGSTEPRRPLPPFRGGGRRRVRSGHGCVTARPTGLVLLRHGESTWNRRTFSPAGGTPTSPTPARSRPGRPGRLMAERGMRRTWCTRRCRPGRSAPPSSPSGRWAVLAAGPAPLAPERAALRRPHRQEQGGDHERYGEEQVFVWRRSYDVRPPPIAADNPLNPNTDRRYAGPPPGAAAGRVPGRRRRPPAPLLVRRLVPDLPPGGRCWSGPRQQPPCPDQAPRRHRRRRHRRPQHPDGRPVHLRARRPPPPRSRARGGALLRSAGRSGPAAEAERRQAEG